MKKITDDLKRIIDKCVAKVIGKLPHKIYQDYKSIDYYVDESFNVDNGILGKCHFFGKKIYISKIVENDMLFQDNNEFGVSIIIHELTHKQQIKEYGLGYCLMNLPGIKRVTTERWAKENEDKAEELIKCHTK